MHTRTSSATAIILAYATILISCAAAKPDAEKGTGKIEITKGETTDSTVEIIIRNATNRRLTFWDVEIRQVDSGSQKILRKHARLSCKEESLIIKEGATDVSPYNTYSVIWDRKDQACNRVSPGAIQVKFWSVGYVKDSRILALSFANREQSGYIQSDTMQLRE